MIMTGYENFSLSQLHGLFSSEIWSSLNFDERINACQEIENRYAAEQNVEPCNVTHQQMDGASYGWQSGQTICLNTSLIRDGCFNVIYRDENGTLQTTQIPAMAPSWNTLETVYHEGTHGVQEATRNIPSTYISPDMDGDLYRIQGIEKEAYAIGQSRTLNALNDVENSSGKLDIARNEYFASIKSDSFQAALQDAVRHYNDPNIESTLQSVISDRENGIVPNNPSESYQSISSLCDNYEIHSSVDIENSGHAAELSSSLGNSQTTIDIDSSSHSTSYNPDVSVQIELSEENNAINDWIDDSVSSTSFSSDISGYTDDGSSSFIDDHSSSFAQTSYYDDGLSDTNNGISLDGALSSDNDISDGIE